MRTELLKLHRRMGIYLKLIDRYETNIKMFRGFREQWVSLQNYERAKGCVNDIKEQQQKIERCYWKIEGISREINNLVNNEMVTIMHESK